MRITPWHCLCPRCWEYLLPAQFLVEGQLSTHCRRCRDSVDTLPEPVDTPAPLSRKEYQRRWAAAKRRAVKQATK